MSIFGYFAINYLELNLKEGAIDGESQRGGAARGDFRGIGSEKKGREGRASTRAQSGKSIQRPLKLYI